MASTNIIIIIIIIIIPSIGLPRPFRSRVRSRHATNKRTDGQTDIHRPSFHKDPPYGGPGILNVQGKIQNNVCKRVL